MTEGQFDTIIVGGGSAGAVLAARLSESGDRRVLLLEAGPDYTEATLPDELRYLSRSISDVHEWGEEVLSTGERRLWYARGRATGGSSSTNGGVAMRAEPPDFASWPERWRWPALLPALCRLERDVDFPEQPYHGADGPIPIVRYPRAEWAPLQVAFTDAALALGHPDCPDHNAPDTSGVGPIPMNRHGRERMSTLRTYLEPARGRANLTIRGGALARRIVLEGRRAVGVELLDGTVVRGGEIVLSAGVVQDPALLWRSGIGPRAGVEGIGVDHVVDAPGVGAGLTDHLVVTYAQRIRSSVVEEDAPSIQTILRWTAPGSARLHDLQLTPFLRRHPDGGRSIAISVSLQLPEGAGTITPVSADPTDKPRLWWPFAGLPENVRRLREGWRRAAEIVQRAGIALDADELARDLDRSDHELDLLIAQEHTAFYHGCGTCRMGDDDASVTDGSGLVRGIDGLRIADAAIIPSVPRSNTNIVVIALAERMAELMG